MSIFQPVTLKWKGEEYSVPANQVMGLIAQIEEYVTIAELLNKSGYKFAKLASAYGSALRYAGARVSDEEIYKEMFTGGKDNQQSNIATAVTGLLSMMIPPEEVVKKSPKKEQQEEDNS